jgi:hypothetical protein
MAPDFEIWATRGLIATMGLALWALAMMLKRAQDERIKNLEALRAIDKNDAQSNIEKLITNFSDENRATREEFARTVNVMSDKITEIGGFFTKMELTSQSHYNSLHEHQQEMRRDIWDISRGGPPSRRMSDQMHDGG